MLHLHHLHVLILLLLRLLLLLLEQVNLLTRLYKIVFLPLEYWPLRGTSLLSLFLNLLLGLLDKVHPLVVCSEDLGEDNES